MIEIEVLHDGKGIYIYKNPGYSFIYIAKLCTFSRLLPTYWIHICSLNVRVGFNCIYIFEISFKKMQLAFLVYHFILIFHYNLGKINKQINNIID